MKHIEWQCSLLQCSESWKLSIMRYFAVVNALSHSAFRASRSTGCSRCEPVGPAKSSLSHRVIILCSPTCSSFISSFSLRIGRSRHSSNSASMRFMEESNLSTLRSSGWGPSGELNGFERCEYNLDSGVDVSK
jgi:hypothetical protein